MVGFFAYDRSDIAGTACQANERSFKTYHRPTETEQSASAYYPPPPPAFSSSPYLGTIGFCSVPPPPPPPPPPPQQGHFPEHSSLVDYRFQRYYSAQPVYEGSYGSVCNALDAAVPPRHHQFLPHPGHFDHPPFSHHRRPSETVDRFQAPLVVATSYSAGGARSTNPLARGSSPDYSSSSSATRPGVTETESPTTLSGGGGLRHLPPSSPSRTAKRREALAVPADQKDGHYWERRKKNNESAKRSRETRRMRAGAAEVSLRKLRDDVVRKRVRRDMLLKQVQDLRYENYLL